MPTCTSVLVGEGEADGHVLCAVLVGVPFSLWCVPAASPAPFVAPVHELCRAN